MANLNITIKELRLELFNSDKGLKMDQKEFNNSDGRYFLYQMDFQDRVLNVTENDNIFVVNHVIK